MNGEIRVLVTRAAPDGSNFAALCRARGLIPILAPVMRIEIEKTEIALDGVGALVFTSANGVRAFTANCAANSAANCAIRALPVFAVGPVTAAQARAAGFANVQAAGGDVGLLAKHIASESAHISGALLHIAGADRARGAGGDLAAMLGARNIAVRRQTLYAARALEALPEAALAAIRAVPPVEWASFFSPRTARLFMALAAAAGVENRLAGIRAACLSEAVAREAGPQHWRSLHLAPEFSAESMAALIVAQQ